MIQVLAKAVFAQSLFGTRAGFPRRERQFIQKGNERSKVRLMARSDAVNADRMVVRSALRMLRSVSMFD